MKEREPREHILGRWGPVTLAGAAALTGTLLWIGLTGGGDPVSKIQDEQPPAGLECETRRLQAGQDPVSIAGALQQEFRDQDLDTGDINLRLDIFLPTIVRRGRAAYAPGLPYMVCLTPEGAFAGVYNSELAPPSEPNH